MIDSERILYYFEHCALMIDNFNDQDTDQEKEWHRKSTDKFLETFYMFCHIGTSALHKCQHPDWEDAFLKAEKEMIDSGYMKPYDVRKQPKES